MASIPEIYPKLREALEQFLHDQAEARSKLAELKDAPDRPSDRSQKWQQIRREAMIRARGFVEKFRKVTEMDLGEEDIVSMEDLAVACATSEFWDKCLWDQQKILLEDNYNCLWSCPYEEGMERVAEDLLCLLKPLPVEEELLPPEGPTDLRIWEIFAAAEVQRRQFAIVACYASCLPPEKRLPEHHELIQSVQAKFKDLVSSFQHMQLHLERQGLLGSELRTKMTCFAVRLKKYCQAAVKKMTSGKNDRSQAIQRWSQLSAEASQIAAQVKEFEVTEVNSLDSWSLVSGGGRPIESSEVGSMASGHSVDSQSSCLSGHGGPHCFLPSYLFKSLQADDTLSSKPSVWANAKDLQKGTKILAADGTLVEVIKLEVQKTNKLLELEIDEAVPFTTTPSHRIMVPSDGDDMTIKAVDLKLGSWVMCSDDMAKKVKGMRFIHVEEQEVLAITFHPDKAVACFLPPEEPVVLTKGRTLKPPRRGGMGGRSVNHELISIPDTAAGEYED